MKIKKNSIENHKISQTIEQKIDLQPYISQKNFNFCFPPQSGFRHIAKSSIFPYHNLKMKILIFSLLILTIAGSIRL